MKVERCVDIMENPLTIITSEYFELRDRHLGRGVIEDVTGDRTIVEYDEIDDLIALLEAFKAERLEA